MSEEVKQKIGEKNRINIQGRKASQETKNKMSLTRKRKTNWGACKLSYEEAKQIKELSIKDYRPNEVFEMLNIDYKLVNNIYSNNSYKSVKVEGWETFYNNKPKLKCNWLDSKKENK